MIQHWEAHSYRPSDKYKGGMKYSRSRSRSNSKEARASPYYPPQPPKQQISVQEELKKEELKVEDVPEQERSCLLFGFPNDANERNLIELFEKQGQKMVSIKNKLMGNWIRKMIAMERSAIFTR